MKLSQNYIYILFLLGMELAWTGLCSKGTFCPFEMVLSLDKVYNFGQIIFITRSEVNVDATLAIESVPDKVTLLEIDTLGLSVVLDVYQTASTKFSNILLLFTFELKPSMFEMFIPPYQTMFLIPKSDDVEKLPLRLDTRMFTYERNENVTTLEEFYKIKGIHLVKQHLATWSESHGLKIATPDIWERRKNLQSISITASVVNWPSYVIIEGYEEHFGDELNAD